MITIAAKFPFHKDQPHHELLSSGWASPREEGTHSLTKQADFSIPVTPAPGDLILQLNLAPLLPNAGAQKNTIALQLNRKTIATRRLGGLCQWRIPIPENAIKNHQLKCTLILSHTDPGVETFRLTEAILLRSRQHPLPAPRHPTHDFPIGWNQPSETILGEGFGLPEDAYAWTYGHRSTALLPLTPSDRTVLMELLPYTGPPGEPRQRIAIGANGNLLGFSEISEHITLAYPLPAQPPGVRAKTLDLTFDNLDANFETSDPVFHFGKPFACMVFGLHLTAALPTAIPAKLLPLAGNLADGSLQNSIKSATGLTTAELAAKFTSLGNRCGIARTQRTMGYNHHSLLGYANSRQTILIRLILEGFASIGDTSLYHFARPALGVGNWVLTIGPEGFNVATPYGQSALPPEEDFKRLALILTRQAEILMELMAESQTIFISRIAEPLSASAADPAALALWAAIRKWSNSPVLMLTYDEQKPPGSVERFANGLIRGYLSPIPSEWESPDAIVSILANCWSLINGETSR